MANDKLAFVKIRKKKTNKAAKDFIKEYYHTTRPNLRSNYLQCPKTQNLEDRNAYSKFQMEFMKDDIKRKNTFDRMFGKFQEMSKREDEKRTNVALCYFLIKAKEVELANAPRDLYEICHQHRVVKDKPNTATLCDHYATQHEDLVAELFSMRSSFANLFKTMKSDMIYDMFCASMTSYLVPVIDLASK